MNDTIRFLDFHQPSLKSGKYQLLLTQEVTVDGQDKTSPVLKREFRVEGPQYHLSPNDIGSVFPPPDSTGDHAYVLPHVTLTRSTLPWERTAKEKTGKKKTHPPWLAILLINENEYNSVNLLTLPQADFDHSARKEAKVRIIEADESFLQKRLPENVDELNLLCHVRETLSTKKETAVVLGARLPHANEMNQAFLVSVENCYPQGFFKTYYNNNQNNKARLVILKSWRFTCGDSKRSLAEQLKNLNMKPMTLQSAINVQGIETGGASLLSYRMRSGSSSAALYRGPLVAGAVTEPQDNSSDKLPLSILRCADSLIRYRKGLGVFDVSYAAAWELGRLLSLSAGSFAQSLIRWKHKEKTAILANKAEQQVSHIGFARSANSPISADEVPEEISSFLNKLASLELVPLNYLLPEEAMLPIDSIRFFQVDHFWLKCLLEGAFSPGRFLSNDHQHELKLRIAIESVNFPVAGFLMRSEIVSAYPGLMAQGIDKKGVKHSSVMRRLSPHLMLCTFDVEVAQIDLHLAPEALHCGVENNFKKFVRKSNGELSKISKKVNIKNRKIAVKDLSDDLAHAAKLLKFDNNGKAGFFALQMIEGVQFMRYKL